jgi:L-alanine-DL-glutamate epimerase-like enolase superfamily enzyme
MKEESEFLINDIEVHAYKIPTDLPEADGTLEWNSTTIVVVFVRAANLEGTGYTYADASVANLIANQLANLVTQKNVMNVSAIRNELIRAVRNSGLRGISSMAISAIDSALWDLKAKVLGCSLTDLLGQTQNGIPVYGSGGFTSYSIDQLQQQFEGWAQRGIRMMKMKIGRDKELDKKRIAAARKAIGEKCELFIDANGAYNMRDALEVAYFAADYNVTWFEEPVSSDDLKGLHAIRSRAPDRMKITAGEYGYDAFYFREMLLAESVDVLQLDATRCGGVSGFLENASLSKTFFTPNSAHTAPMIHIPACCACENVLHIEYFHDHSRIENMFFDNVPQPINGILSPDNSIHGNGIIFRYSDAEKFRVI